MEQDELVIPHTPPDLGVAVDPSRGAPPVQRYIRTYARDMAVVQKGGSPDLVPLREETSGPPEEGTSAAGLPSVPFTPEQAPVPVPETVSQAAPVRAAAVAPAETVVATYEQGLQEAALRAERNVPSSPAAASWQHGEEERETVINRLREKARSMGLPTDEIPPHGEPTVIHEDIVAPHPAPPRESLEVPASTPIQPPASPLSVPSYIASTGIPALPGEPVPVAPPPPPPPEPQAPTPSPFTLAPEGAELPASAEVSPPEAAPPTPFTLVPQANEPSLLHTYTTDFSGQVGATHASASAILAAEADARTAAPLPVPQSTEAPPRGQRAVLVAAVLVVLGGGILYAAYAYYAAHTGPVALVLAPSVPIFVDERETVSGEGTPLLSAFSQSVGRPLPGGAVRLVYDPTATSTGASVFNRLALPAPGILLRNIKADGSMAGVVSAGGVQTPFFILSVTSYGDTFAGMLAWESSMIRTLEGLYPAYPAGSGSPTAPATLTAPAVTSVVAPPSARQGFADEVVSNHDTRVYRDSAGRSILIYGYWNQDTLVIARDEAAFAAVLSRLASARRH